MSTVILLGGWIVLLGTAGWSPGHARPWIRWSALGLILVTLLVSDLWQAVVRALQGHESPPLGGPDAAYLSLWILVLLPILNRRLDAGTLGATLLSGLVAGAAFGLAQESASLILMGWAGPDPGQTSDRITAGVHVILGLAGLSLRCLLDHPTQDWSWARFHWDYPVWYAGLIAMQQAAAP
ncbi:hypothetical protein [Thermochromatium tepidum]|jgi:hypothetical protein|uniref:Uncharacterized protein n=1 Tax=Thermochromatium tepidum ATCC 43061 TaxID=316276 RepID=A0A6I6EGB4_THETI|nr:hypothetical protein [Thermochromatium tepidum]QGU32357.1 hypothetical protein E6P07_04740 [Thermochromatium tepidum ATCC 43061]